MNFIKKIILPSLMALSLILFIYTYFRSEIIWHGRLREYYNWFYILSLFLFFFSILNYFLSEKLLRYSIIFFLSFFFSLYISESFIIYKKIKNKNKISHQQSLKEKIYERESGIKWDKRSRSEIYLDLKSINPSIAVTVPPSFFINENFSVFPLSGLSSSQTISCNENGFYSVYYSDRYGFNNPDNEWNQTQVEYLIIGDSFAHGECVNRPNDLTSVLRVLSEKSALNLAYGGNGPLIKYAVLREYLNKNVKKVFWVHFEGNDLLDLIDELENKILLNYLNNPSFSQQLIFNQKKINQLVNYAIDIEINNKSVNKERITNLTRFVKLWNLREFLFNYNLKFKLPYLEYKNILKLTNELVKQNDSKLYFIYLPEFSRYKKNYKKKNYDMIKKIVYELNIPFIDIPNEVFKKEKNPLKLFPFESYGHYTVEGYHKVGKAIYKLTKD